MDRFIAAALCVELVGVTDPQEYLGRLLRAGTSAAQVTGAARAGGDPTLESRHGVVAAMLAVAERRLNAGGPAPRVLADTCFDLIVLSYVWHVSETLAGACHPSAAPGFTLRRVVEMVRGGPGRAVERAAAARVNRHALPRMRLETAAFLYAACVAHRWLTREKAQDLSRHYRLRDVGQVRGLRPLGNDHPFAGLTLADVVAGGSTQHFRIYVDERYQAALRALARWEVFVAWSRYVRCGAMLGDPTPRTR